MKSLYLRAGLSLLCAAILAGCGGGSGSMALGGTVTGLTKDGLVLKNGNEVLPVAANGGAAITFQFPTLVAVDQQFDIEFQTQPTGASCTITNNKNKANVYTVGQTLVSCSTFTYTLGGKASGLKGTGLVLANGADTVAIAPSANPADVLNFSFPTKVADGAPFGVTVLAQPSNPAQVCSVASNTGTMPSGDYSGLVVTCN